MTKTALITGASRGIGQSISTSLASNHHLILVSRNLDRLEISRKEIQSKNQVSLIPLDLSIENPLDFSKIPENIDVLVNCAGISSNRLLLRSSLVEIQRILNTNLLSSILLTQYVLKGMIRRKSGCIINISSIVGYGMGNAGQSVYSASKAGIIGFTKSLAKEVGSKGIRVNCVAPGFINTNMIQGSSNLLIFRYIKRKDK